MYILIVKSYIEKGHNDALINPKKWFKLKIETKDGRFRYSLYDVYYEFQTKDFGADSVKVNEPFEDWVNRPLKTKSKRKINKIQEFYNAYSNDLNNSFWDLIESLILSMQQVETEEW